VYQVTKFIFPGIILVVSFGSTVISPEMVPHLFRYPYLYSLPFIPLTFCIILGIWFNQTRFSLSALFEAVLLISLLFMAPSPISPATSNAVLLTLAFAFLIFFLFHEKSLCTPAGAFRIFLAFSPAALLAVPNTVFASAQTKVALLIPQWIHSIQVLSLPLPVAAFLGIVLLLFILLPREGDHLIGTLLFFTIIPVIAALLYYAGWPSVVSQDQPDTQEAFLLFFFSAAGINCLYGTLELTYGTAFRDPLTKLPARAALKSALLSVPRRFAIAMIDIDHFKKINDTYGHKTGDQALRFVAGRMQRVRNGKLYRYGGEEFVIIFHKNALEDAETYLQEIHDEIRNAPFFIRGTDRPEKAGKTTYKQRGKGSRAANSINITVSIGLAYAQRGKAGESSEEVLAAADKALYKAKKKGRNQIVCARS